MRGRYDGGGDIGERGACTRLSGSSYKSVGSTVC